MELWLYGPFHNNLPWFGSGSGTGDKCALMSPVTQAFCVIKLLFGSPMRSASKNRIIVT